LGVVIIFAGVFHDVLQEFWPDADQKSARKNNSSAQNNNDNGFPCQQALI
jgi:hypothetical protein